jgi:hypothetical protein
VSWQSGLLEPPFKRLRGMGRTSAAATSSPSFPRPPDLPTLDGEPLENPTFREMNLVWVRCSKKVALRFTKT